MQQPDLLKKEEKFCSIKELILLLPTIIKSILHQQLNVLSPIRLILYEFEAISRPIVIFLHGIFFRMFQIPE